MGGGKGGGGPTIPEFVKESQQRVADMSQELYGISQPSLQLGAGQIQSLLQTGGRGAAVPALTRAQNAQRQAAVAANEAINRQMARAGDTEGTLNPIRERIGQQQVQAVESIGPQIAAPLITAFMSQALGGPGTANAGYASGAQALASGLRRPAQGGGGNIMGGAMQLGSTLASMYGGGGGVGSYGAKGQQSGINPHTGGMIVGQSGMLGGGV